MTDDLPLAAHPSVTDTVGHFNIFWTRHRHEKVFTRDLRTHGVGYYLPLRKHVRFWRGRRRESWLPVFPCMVFVANGEEGRDLASRSPLQIGQMPLALSYQPVLRRELLQLELVLTHEPEIEAFPQLIAGRDVQVRQGCGHWAAGLRGKIDRRQHRDVFCILITTMGRSVPVEDVPGELLEVIEDAA